MALEDASCMCIMHWGAISVFPSGLQTRESAQNEWNTTEWEPRTFLAPKEWRPQTQTSGAQTECGAEEWRHKFRPFFLRSHMFISFPSLWGVFVELGLDCSCLKFGGPKVHIWSCLVILWSRAGPWGRASKGVGPERQRPRKEGPKPRKGGSPEGWLPQSRRDANGAASRRHVSMLCWLTSKMSSGNNWFLKLFMCCFFMSSYFHVWSLLSSFFFFVGVFCLPCSCLQVWDLFESGFGGLGIFGFGDFSLLRQQFYGDFM